MCGTQHHTESMSCMPCNATATRDARWWHHVWLGVQVVRHNSLSCSAAIAKRSVACSTVPLVVQLLAEPFRSKPGWPTWRVGQKALNPTIKDAEGVRGTDARAYMKLECPGFPRSNLQWPDMLAQIQRMGPYTANSCPIPSGRF